MAASVRAVSHLRGRADFLTVHHWIKTLQEMKEPHTLWDQDVTGGLRDLFTWENILQSGKGD